ncbi:probable 2-oxoglutarate-dependent dioxygenase AOP1 [Papaver somniferum]|uniref:probable 2-oxoglutarate-dependent dioxygenase AOP1 n=1 Tax=Papaver somniferum TaxID=3469 RepID=UPI000E6FD5A3|nr:probable 2-oxoglutarate-dependent dioxygenase AOP1 [Papaver somniferum]
MSKTMVEVEHIIRKMVFESLGVEKYYDSSIEESQNIMRVMKYQAPPSKEPAIGLHTHTDIGILTEGSWLKVLPQKGALTIFVGDALRPLRAWSNGRVYAAKHRVMMSGEKDRYSYGLFASPKEEAVILAPRELVDKEHRLLFRPFTHADFTLHPCRLHSLLLSQHS